MFNLEKKIQEIFDDYFDQDITINSSFHLAVELHYLYKEKGFHPSEYVEDITKQKSDIKNWTDAILRIKFFIDQCEVSDAIH